MDLCYRLIYLLLVGQVDLVGQSAQVVQVLPNLNHHYHRLLLDLVLLVLLVHLYHLLNLLILIIPYLPLDLQVHDHLCLLLAQQDQLGQEIHLKR